MRIETSPLMPLEDIFRQLKPFLLTMTLCTPRLLTAFLVSPFFNTDMITGATRNCIVLAFALIVFPTTLSFIQTNEPPLGFIFSTVIKEAVLGALMGYLAAMFFHAISAVGNIIDQQRGASFASVIDPSSGNESTPLGTLFMQAAIIIFFTCGGLMVFLTAVYDSYHFWPINSFWPRFDPAFITFFLKTLDQLMSVALVLSAPVLIALFISEMGLALINRFAPQLNVFFLSMPVKSAMAMLMMLFYLEIFFKFLRSGFLQRWHFFEMLKEVVK